MCENNLSYNTSFGMARQNLSLMKKWNVLLMTPYWLFVCHTSIENMIVKQDLKLRNLRSYGKLQTILIFQCYMKKEETE